MFNRLQAGALQGVGATAVRLGPLVSRSRVQLDGFKSRALRAEAPAHQRHLYATVWRAVDVVHAEGAKVLAISDDVSVRCERLSARVGPEKLVEKLQGGEFVIIMAAAAVQRGACATLPLFALEVALMLVQMRATTDGTLGLWLLTGGTKATLQSAAHAGGWGLGRSARVELLLPVVCIDAALDVAFTSSPYGGARAGRPRTIGACASASDRPFESGWTCAFAF